MNREIAHHLSGRSPGVSWAIVLGLSALALLWPLAALTGVGDLLGSARPFVLIATIAAVWIGVVGLGRVARPILTLSLVGLGYGVVLLLLGFISSAVGGQALAGPSHVTPMIALPSLALDTFFGFITGLIAAAVQRVRGPVS